jgi:hypothetical protein
MSGFPYLDSQNVMDFLIPKTVEPTKLYHHWILIFRR